MSRWYEHALPWAVACVLAVAGACGAASRHNGNDLVDQVRRYNEGLKWRRYPAAAVHIAPAERNAFLDERADLDDDLRIDLWELKRVGYTPGADRAQVRVEYTWHLDSRGIVHKTTSRQRWERHGDHWLVVDERRVRGEEMPGLPEPVPEEDAGPVRADAGAGPIAPARPQAGAERGAKPPHSIASGRKHN
jgi:hypothetical protein